MVKPHCTECSKKCVGDVLKVGEKYFHQNCFKCKDCSSHLDTGGFFFRDGDYYCPKDYTIRFSNKCFICSKLIESEIVSALNNHFHRNCFKCSICSNIFSPGDKVTMKSDQFLCNSCISNPISESVNVKMRYLSDRKAPDQLLNKVLLSDDIMTDQGYISADPTSLSFPTPNTAFDQQTISPSNMTEKRTKSRSSLTRSLFEFGKFYRSSYLDIQESREKERQSHLKKSSGRPSTWQCSNNFHLPISKKSYSKSQKNDILSLRSGIDCAVSPSLKKMISASESDVNDKEIVIRLSSYPAGEKPLDNIPIPIERDDWPAPLSTAVLLKEKMLRRKNFFNGPSCSNSLNISGGDFVEYSQSLNHLVPVTPESQHRNLTEILRNDPKFFSNRKLEDVISASRSPNASMEPTSKPRYNNHKDKSKSRDSTYFNDSQRHNGYSLEFISSTTRSFMAGRIPHEIYGARTDRSPCNSCPKLKPGYTQGLLHEIKSHSSQEPPQTERNNNNKRSIPSNYIWTAVRTMSDNFDVQLRNIEYDSTLEETLYDNQDDLSSSEVDLVTGLKITKNKYGKDKIKEQTVTSDKSSINSKIESLETWSCWSQKPLPVIKNAVVSYFDLISKEPKILKGLDKNRLETYLSMEEFQRIFNLNRPDFYRLPEWKQNDLKRRVNLF